MEYTNLYNGKQINAKLLRSKPNANKATIILIDGFFDIAYDAKGNSIWPFNNNKKFGTSELGIDPNEFDIYTIGLKKDCTGLGDAALEVSEFISALPEYQQLNLLGISKGGPVFCKALEGLSNTLLEKINLFTVSSPFTGTILATPEKLKQEAHKKLSFLGDWAYKNMYEKTYTYSPVDSDIGIDTTFIKSLETSKAFLKKVNFTNIVTQCTSNTFFQSCRKGDINAIMLHILNLAIVKGDGIVSTESQEAFSKLATNIIYLSSPHSWTLSHAKIANQIGKIMAQTTLDREFKLGIKIGDIKNSLLIEPIIYTKQREGSTNEHE